MQPGKQDSLEDAFAQAEREGEGEFFDDSVEHEPEW
jgi:hypothetical protein